MTPHSQFQVFVLCLVLALGLARPDSGGHVPLPGPGISYGGIPYGSMSGNVANYFKRAPSLPAYPNLRRNSEFEYAPVLQYL